MPRWSMLIPSLATIVLLAACESSGVRLQANYSEATYDHNNFVLYHGNRETPVVLAGNPFAIGKGAFDRTVIEAMQGANPGPRTLFTQAPADVGTEGWRVVMVFDPVLSAAGLCSGAPAPSGRASETVRLVAAWCWGQRLDSEVTAWLPRPVPGPDDPAFTALLRQTVAHLFRQHMDMELLRDDSGDIPPNP